MQRHTEIPRQGWQSKIEGQGLIYWPTALPNGETMSYWNEDNYYSLTAAEVAEMEGTIPILLEMLVEAGDFIIDNELWPAMGIPGWVTHRIEETWTREPPMLLGRFDFGLGGDGQIKLFEYNCDCPAALAETAIQWHWAVDNFGPDVQQWNWVHEAIIEQWKGLAPYVFEPLYFFYTNTDKEGEDFVTISYLADLAQQAGLRSIITEIEAIGLSDHGFVDGNGDRIRTAYKMYPWERMIRDAYGRDAIHFYGNGLDDSTMWIEPIWKMLWSNKGILPVLWHLFPDHQNLLPAYFEQGGRPVDVFGDALSPEAEDRLYGPGVVRKPLFGYEGADIKILAGRSGTVLEQGPREGFGEEGVVLQQLMDLGTYDHHHPVLGIWTVDTDVCGLGIREHMNLITDRYCRFVPHVVT